MTHQGPEVIHDTHTVYPNFNSPIVNDNGKASRVWQKIFLDIWKKANAKQAPGLILLWGGKGTPEGYLLCDGKSVNKADYPELFDAIGTTWGSDDSKTFKLPDLGDLGAPAVIKI